MCVAAVFGYNNQKSLGKQPVTDDGNNASHNAYMKQKIPIFIAKQCVMQIDKNVTLD